MAPSMANDRPYDDDTMDASPTTFCGSCHCGSIRFEADIDLREGTRRCNCSFCVKTRFWKGFVNGDHFRLMSGERFLSNYRFGDGVMRYVFCDCCGVALFGRAELDGRDSDFYVVNVACLDDVTPRELLAAPVGFEDGRNDDWWSLPAETRHL